MSEEQVWMYYFLTGANCCRAFATLDAALRYLAWDEADGEQSTIAIEDADGTVYDDDALKQRLDIYKREHPSPPRQYRVWRGERWEVQGQEAIR